MHLISEHLCKAGKSLPRKRGRPSLAASTSDSPAPRHGGSPAVSNPGTPTSKRMRKIQEKHQELPLNSVRTDSIGHWPEWQKKRQHCQVCSMKTYTKCSKRKIFLCYNEKKKLFVSISRKITCFNL